MEGEFFSKAVKRMGWRLSSAVLPFTVNFIIAASGVRFGKRYWA
jgi:hypothetical protein